MADFMEFHGVSLFGMAGDVSVDVSADFPVSAEFHGFTDLSVSSYHSGGCVRIVLPEPLWCGSGVCAMDGGRGLFRVAHDWFVCFVPYDIPESAVI